MEFLGYQHKDDVNPFFMMLSTPACHDPRTPAPQYKHAFKYAEAPKEGSYNYHAEVGFRWWEFLYQSSKADAQLASHNSYHMSHRAFSWSPLPSGIRISTIKMVGILRRSEKQAMSSRIMPTTQCTSAESRKFAMPLMTPGVALYAVITPCAFQILQIRGGWLLKRARVGANRPPHTLLITQ
jgi:hypothetical protein